MSVSADSNDPLHEQLARVHTLDALFDWRVARTPRREAYRFHDAAAARWAGVTWAEAGERVARFVAALAGLRLARGSRVAILLPNGLDAVCADQAALALALVPVPLHALDNPASIAYILADSDASVLIAGTQAQWRAIAALGTPLPALAQVVVLDRDPGAAATAASDASAANGAGGAATAVQEASGTAARVPVAVCADWLAAAAPLSASALPARPQPPELAALVYTSGTTGKPKGVMLTHANVVSNVKATLQRVAPHEDDVFLSFLPLSHTFERTAGYYLPIASGACVAFSRSTALLAEDMKTVRPTILISVPRIYERVYAVLQSRLAGSPLRARLFERAQAIGWRRFRARQALPGEPDPVAPAWWDSLAWPLLSRLVAQPLMTQFGGRLRVAVSGGAPLSHAIARCFLGLGLPLVQGYGMTETSPVVAANAPDDNDPATVGRPLVGVEVRIGENQELQVRGPSVMRGYWKREEDTLRAFADGWLRTGDQAAIEAGRIRILGRVKEIIVTSTGEKIAPADLELAICADPTFEQAYVFGDNRPFIGGIVVLERARWRQLATQLGLDPDDPASLEAAPAREALLARVRRLTADFPHYAQPRAIALTLEPWTTDNSLLTPTLKLKRNNLAARFAERIEQLYRR
jgi:long-chain acyl-CoA synthetase